jgi:hypothetical protein
VHHHTIQINQPTRCSSFTSLLLDVYVWLNMFRASSRPSSGAYNCNRSLWFYRWKEAAGALLVVVWPVITGQTTTNNTSALFPLHLATILFSELANKGFNWFADCQRVGGNPFVDLREHAGFCHLVLLVCIPVPNILLLPVITGQTTTNNASAASFQR